MLKYGDRMIPIFYFNYLYLGERERERIFVIGYDDIFLVIIVNLFIWVKFDCFKLKLFDVYFPWVQCNNNNGKDLRINFSWLVY